MDKAAQLGIASWCGVTGIIMLILLVLCSKSYKRRKKLLSETTQSSDPQENTTQTNTQSFGNILYRVPESRNSNNNRSKENRRSSRNIHDKRSERLKPKQKDRNKSISDLRKQESKSRHVNGKSKDTEKKSFIITQTETNTDRRAAGFGRNVLFRDSHPLIARSYNGNHERSSFYSLRDFPIDRIQIPRAHLTSSGVKENLV